MCVCAGGTGASVVPVTRAIREHRAPTHAVARRAPPLALAAAAVPCLPTIADGALAPALAGIAGLSPLLTLDAPASPVSTSGIATRLGTLGAVGDALASSGGGFGTAPAGGGGGGGGGGGSGGGGSAPGTGGATPGSGGIIPSVSNAPEPTSWLLMIGGFGVLGGAMRYARKASVKV